MSPWAGLPNQRLQLAGADRSGLHPGADRRWRSAERRIRDVQAFRLQLNRKVVRQRHLRVQSLEGLPVPKAFVEATGLNRCLYLGLGIEGAGALAVLAALVLMRLDIERFVPVLMLGGISLAFVGLVYGWHAVRCPECDLSVTWHAMSKLPHGEHSSWLWSFEQCPRCRYYPGAEAEPGS